MTSLEINIENARKDAKACDLKITAPKHTSMELQSDHTSDVEHDAINVYAFFVGGSLIESDISQIQIIKLIRAAAATRLQNQTQTVFHALLGS